MNSAQEADMGWSTHHNASGLIYYAPQHAYRGYTLITNVSGHDARLIDMEGRVCHTWHSDEGIGYGYLLPNGNLLLRTGPAAEEVSFLSRPERELPPPLLRLRPLRSLTPLAG